MTRVACPATEDYLLLIALHGTAHHVETVVRHFRRVKESAELLREARQQANRFLRWSYDTDGSLILKARLPAETGAMLEDLTGAGAGFRGYEWGVLAVRQVWIMLAWKLKPLTPAPAPLKGSIANYAGLWHVRRTNRCVCGSRQSLKGDGLKSVTPCRTFSAAYADDLSCSRVQRRSL